ncbi:MAG: hypothetical protein JOZ62_22160, partial [Acidobacteriaceae bacterium]|nr:hypothetical protein [Acidobacteriaceae bacterium]
MRSKRRVLVTIAVAVAGCAMVSGQQDVAADRQHGVGRLSIVQGEVDVRRGDSRELVAAAVNAPVVGRD